MPGRFLARLDHVLVKAGLAACLAGCMYVPVGTLPALEEAAAPAPAPGLDVNLRAVFRNGGYLLQELVKPYSRQDVSHLVVTVTPTTGGGGIPILERDLAGAALLADIPITGLRPDTAYRITGRAFARPGRDPADILSVDASSSIELKVTRDDRPGPVALPIQLRDRVFDGQASASVLILPGGVTDLGRERISSGAQVSLALNLAARRGVQTVRQPWGLADVDHVIVIPRLYVPVVGYRPLSPVTGLPTTRPEEPFVSLTIPGNRLTDQIPLRLGNLQHEQDYLIEATAYDAVGTALTDSGVMNIRVERDDQVQLSDSLLRLWFKQRPFTGTVRVRLVRRDPALTFARTEIRIQWLQAGSIGEVLDAPLSLARFEGSLTLNRLAPHANYVLEARGLDASGSVLLTTRTLVNVTNDDDLGEIVAEL